MRVLKSYNDIKLPINNSNIICSTCKNDRFNVKLVKENIEYSGFHLHTECVTCGKLERYNYQIGKNKMFLNE